MSLYQRRAGACASALPPELLTIALGSTRISQLHDDCIQREEESNGWFLYKPWHMNRAVWSVSSQTEEQRVLRDAMSALMCIIMTHGTDRWRMAVTARAVREAPDVLWSSMAATRNR